MVRTKPVSFGLFLLPSGRPRLRFGLFFDPFGLPRFRLRGAASTTAVRRLHRRSDLNPLSQAVKSQADKHQDKTIEVKAAGDIFLDGQAVTKETLEDRIGQLPKETSFLIRADRNLAFQGFVDVVNVLKRLNFNRVAIQTLNSR